MSSFSKKNEQLINILANFTVYSDITPLIEYLRSSQLHILNHHLAHIITSHVRVAMNQFKAITSSLSGLNAAMR